MGFFKDVIVSGIKKAIVKKATKETVNFAVKSIDKVEEKIEDGKIDKFLNDSNSHVHLVINKKYAFKDNFKVLNENEETKYVIKSSFFSLGRKLIVYDNVENEKLGEVKQKVFKFGSSYEFEINLKNGKIGTIKKDNNFIKKRKFNFNFDNWEIEGNFIGSSYKIKRGEEVIMEISDKILFREATYFIDIFNPDYEIVCLMVALAVMAIEKW